MRYLMNKWYMQIAISVAIMLVSASVFLCVIKFLGFENLTINDMMVSFVGILATFVVISNVAQVQEIKHEMDKRLESLEHTKSEIEQMYIEADDYIRKCQTAYEDDDSVKLALKLISHPLNDFSVIFADSPQNKQFPDKVRWRFRNGKLMYYYNDEVVSDTDISLIMFIDGYAYTHSHVETLMRQYIEK